jgi:hypothetical protein
MKKLLSNVVSLVLFMVLVLLTWGVSPVLAAQAASSKNMELVGTNDLQARSTYQPIVHRYPGDRYIFFGGEHPLATNPVTGLQLPSFNPLTKLNEPDGTSIVDVTNPKKPVYLAHIPVGTPVGPPLTPTNGGAQMVRVCDGSVLPIGNTKVYMLRSYASSAHEIWDVTDPSKPKPVRTVAGGNPVIGSLVTTHKSWWECDSGIAYIVGRRSVDTAEGWQPGNEHHIFIFDLRDPANPVFLRDWALDGQQPGGVLPPHFTLIPQIHGPISTGPSKDHTLLGNSPNPIAATGATLDRVYFAYGIGNNGVMQIVDRTKLLPPPWGTGVKCGSIASTLTPPACTDFHTAEVGRWVMNPVNGAHTSYPIGNIAVPDFAVNDQGQVRDFVVVTSEETSNQCTGPRNLTTMVEVTENVLGQPGSRPQGQATFQVLEETGEFCDVGGRFGPHGTQEEFGPPFYQKLIFVSYFNAGVRAVDVRDPFRPTEVGFFIPATNANTDFRCVDNSDPGTCKIAIQTNNVATDDRGFIYIVDRADTGLHILQLTGAALKVVTGK